MRELALVFLKLGTIAFGGPAAHIAMMEDEVVRRRAWLTREEFLDYLGATNLIPGPNSTELAIHVGYARAGFAGLVVAGASFILPAAFIVAMIAWGYVRFGRLPAVEGLLYGIKPVVIAVVLQALVGLARTALKTTWLIVAAVACVVAAAAGVNELAILGGAVIVALAFGSLAFPKSSDGGANQRMLAPIMLQAGAVGGGSAISVSLLPLFGVFLKIGSILFGSGYVLLAFLRSDLVERLHWLTERQLLDAVAVGQMTPGPVFTTATFIGYVLHGASGAAVATIGIFLPAFVFVAISGTLIPAMRGSPTARAVLDAVNVASLALMAVVTVQLARAAVVDFTTLVLAAIAGVLLLRRKVNSAWLVLGGAVVGLVSRA